MNNSEKSMVVVGSVVVGGLLATGVYKGVKYLQGKFSKKNEDNLTVIEGDDLQEAAEKL